MALFKKRTANSLEHIDKLYKELSMQIEMNQELKKDNESLKKELLGQQKELARFKKNLREQPLSQLKILHQELSFLCQEVESIIQEQGEPLATEMLAITRDICVDAFELLNILKKPDEKA